MATVGAVRGHAEHGHGEGHGVAKTEQGTNDGSGRRCAVVTP